MTTATLISAAPPWQGGPPPFLPGVLMFCLLILLALGAVAFVIARRRGHGPPWVTPPAPGPEESARTVLAERFARGDITVEEFMERASALNWTPGQGGDQRRP
ncbi:SHOCT domain-containing protein [Nocardiopsis sp. MG754419]|uniref:SHOCT domain-containing protein n=1 Tax=Nocardiopsis sp. MG754419 TaxID=2259865 RepID=UPI001BA950F3|nr:SHOCT domain-containing protein [Nocardiopsis sp. MG754419]MBR8745475.1 SHOCT domain-containing protein [Nocardiopsis sp. MG754419]